MVKRWIKLVVLVLLTGTTAPGLSLADPGHEILVLGGTGQLGARIVRLLVDGGQDVAVFVRPTSDRARLEGLDVAYVVGDLVDGESVMAAFRTARPRVVIVAVSAPVTLKGFYDTMTRNLVAAAEAVGTETVIYSGAVGAGDNMKLHPDIPWSRVPNLEPRMIDHGVGEANLLASDLKVTIIRNSRVWPDRFEATGKAVLMEDQSVMMPIIRADLALLTVQCLDKAACVGKIYHAGDPSLVGKERPPE